MKRPPFSLARWRAWRARHYNDGTPRGEDELGWLMLELLSTRRGAIAVLRTDRRAAKERRPQHTPHPPANAWETHTAYGRRRGRRTTRTR